MHQRGKADDGRSQGATRAQKEVRRLRGATIAMKRKWAIGRAKRKRDLCRASIESHGRCRAHIGHHGGTHGTDRAQVVWGSPLSILIVIGWLVSIEECRYMWR